MVESYAAIRPASASSRRVAIVGSTQDLAADEPGVILATPVPVQGAVEVHEHVVTANVGVWPTSAGGDEAGWETLVRIGGRQAVGIRDGPPRRAIVGLEAAAWGGTPDFVIFWTNLLDWLADSQPRYVSRQAGEMGSGWTALQPRQGLEPGMWPGIYRRADGELAAIHAGAVSEFAAPAPNVAARLAALRDRGPLGTTGRAAGPWLLLAAVALVVAAGLVWRKEG
jgi:hypothetical protein